MEELRELLGEELYNQLAAKLGDRKIVIDDGRLIPKHRLDELSDKIKSLQSIIDDRDKQLKDLKKAAEGNEVLVKQIEDQQKINKEQKESYEKELVKLQKKTALKESLREQGAKYPDLLADKFDLDKIELEGEKVKDAENVIKPYKEQYKDLFGEVKMQGKSPNDGNNPLNNPYGSNPWKAETKNLTLQGKILTEKPELATQLKAAAGVK